MKQTHKPTDMSAPLTSIETALSEAAAVRFAAPTDAERTRATLVASRAVGKAVALRKLSVCLFPIRRDSHK